MTTPEKSPTSSSDLTKSGQDKQFRQRPHADSIPCPALLAFYNNGLLQPADDGTVATEQLQEVLKCVGVSPAIRKLLIRAADKTDGIPESFNLFELRDSNLDHTGSTGVRDPQVSPEKLQEALLNFSENGRMYSANFAAAAAHAYSKDPGLVGTTLQNIEFTALLEVFGREDEKGQRYLTNEDVSGLWIEGKFPDSWQPRPNGEIGLDDILKNVSKMTLQRFLRSWPNLFS